MHSWLKVNVTISWFRRALGRMPLWQTLALGWTLALKGGPTCVLQVHVSLLRALAEDETRAQRAQHSMDLALLDAVTWPEYLWDFLRIVRDSSGHLSSALSVPQQDSTQPAAQVSLPAAALNVCVPHRAEIIASNRHLFSMQWVRLTPPVASQATVRSL